MGIFKNLTGQIFGKLTVIKKIENHQNGKIQYLCECSCKFHTQINVIGENLKSGNTTKCTKCREWKFNDLTEQQYGLWKVIKRVEDNKRGTVWLCECQCENKTLKNVLGNSLVLGKSKSCGCLTYKSIVGKKYSQLLIINEYCINNIWFCDADCDCGNKAIKIYKASIVNGNTKSCGCIRKEICKIANLKHGKKGSHIYRLYYGMIDRCTNKNNESYKDYGERGITVSDEWLGDNGFIKFNEWAVNNGYKENLSIERIDVNKGYNKNNCTWIPKNKQSQNKRNSIKVVYQGKERLLAELIYELGLQEGIKTIPNRIKRGWDVEKALFTPIGVISNSKGESKIKDYLIDNNIKYRASKTFKGLIGLGNGLLSYDFYLVDYNLLIEYQGNYHDGTANNQSKKDLERQQEHDKRKREYANINNIKLLEIWYWDFDNIEGIFQNEFLEMIGRKG
jgi:hypothetical protein